MRGRFALTPRSKLPLGPDLVAICAEERWPRGWGLMLAFGTSAAMWAALSAGVAAMWSLLGP